MIIEHFEGVFAPIPTPFSIKDRTINFDFIKRHLQFLNEKGVHGIVVLGTNGEFPSLSIEERKNVMSWVMKFRGQLKVIAQTGTSSFVETVALCDFAKDIGVDGVLIATPYYFKNISEDGLVAYYLEILNRVELPVFLYNMPQNTQIRITNQVIDALLDYKQLLGLKDSLGDPEILNSFLKSFRQLHIFVGHDSLLPMAMELGAGGTITAAANAVPELVLSLYNSLKRKQDATRLQQLLSAYRRLLTNYPIHAATKYILYLRGFEPSSVRPPLQDLTDAQKRDLERALDQIGFRFENANLMIPD